MSLQEWRQGELLLCDTCNRKKNNAQKRVDISDIDDEITAMNDG
jgi:exonuclease VII small subunit